MDSSKTRIWRGGLEGITHGPVSDVPEEPGSQFRATRILPIERLLPMAAKPQPPEPRRPASVHPPKRARDESTLRIPGRKRRWPLVLAGMFTLIAVVGAQVRLMAANRRPEAAASQGETRVGEIESAASTSAPVAPASAKPEIVAGLESKRQVEATLAQHSVVAQPARPTHAAAARTARRAKNAAFEPASQPGGLNPADRSRLERGAVDSVIAGDYANAARMYRELSASDSERAFQVAARILDARKAAR